MDRDAILAAIAELARTKLHWSGPVRPEMRLIEDIQLDSIQLMTLAMEVEDRFRICLEEEDEAEIKTVGDLVETVETKLAS